MFWHVFAARDRFSIRRTRVAEGRAPGISVAPPRNLELPPTMSELAAGHAVEIGRPNYRTTALIIASALFMEQFNSTVLATALPTMARHFGVTASHMSIALTSYLLSLAVGIPASGYLRRPVRRADVIFLSHRRCSPSVRFCARRRQPSHAGPGADGAGRGRRDDDPCGAARAAAQRRRADLVSAMSWFLVPA